MKILLCNSAFTGGGITSYAFEVISFLKKNHEMFLMVKDHALLQDSDVKKYAFDMSNITYENACNVYNVITNEIKPDIIISSNARVISLLAPFLDNSIKIISVSHSLKYSDADVAGYNAEYFDRIIALSEHGKNYLESKFKIHNKSKIKVIFNFVNEKKDWEKKLNDKLGNKVLNIVYSGGGTAVKGPDIVVRILRKLLDSELNFKFFWMGNTLPPLHSLKINPDIKTLFRPDKRLIFTGHLKREDAMKLLEDTNIYLFPSRREGCPMSLLEVMRVGAIPLVADYPHGSIELIKEGFNGFIIGKKNINGFVNKIQDIIEHHDRYHNIYLNNIEYFQSNLTDKVWECKMMEVVNSLESDHTCRTALLDKKQYKKSFCEFNRILKLDKFFQLFSENVPSALSIFKQKYINLNF